MRRLDGFSAFMVYNDIPRCYQHTLKIGIIDWADDPSGYSYDKVYKRINDWVSVTPMLKWKLAMVPFSINHPVWVQDLDFNPDYHIRRIAIPEPCDKKTFNELVSQLYAQPLDKSRPLWTIWVVEGLKNGQTALVCMFHHAYADGAGAGMVFQRLMSDKDASDFVPETSEQYGVDSQKNPSDWRIFMHGLIDLPVAFVKYIPALAVMVLRHRRLSKDYKLQGYELPPGPLDAPDSPLNAVFSHGRTFAYTSFDLVVLKQLCKHFQVTVNDLFVAIVSSAIREYYSANELSLEAPLVVNIPVNVRTEDQKTEVVGNYISNSYMSAPIHLSDAGERLNAVAASGQVMKAHNKAIGGAGFGSATELVHPATYEFLNWGIRRKKGQLKILGNFACSNVRGPSEPMRFGKAKVATWLSIGQVGSGVGLNVTAWSYNKQFNICLMAESKIVPEGEVFTDYLTEAYIEYKTLAEQQGLQIETENNNGEL